MQSTTAYRKSQAVGAYANSLNRSQRTVPKTHFGIIYLLMISCHGIRDTHVHAGCRQHMLRATAHRATLLHSNSKQHSRDRHHAVLHASITAYTNILTSFHMLFPDLGFTVVTPKVLGNTYTTAWTLHSALFPSHDHGPWTLGCSDAVLTPT